MVFRDFFVNFQVQVCTEEEFDSNFKNNTEWNFSLHLVEKNTESPTSH